MFGMPLAGAGHLEWRPRHTYPLARVPRIARTLPRARTEAGDRPGIRAMPARDGQAPRSGQTQRLPHVHRLVGREHVLVQVVDLLPTVAVAELDLGDLPQALAALDDVRLVARALR